MAFEDQKQSKTSKPLQDCVPTEILQEILFRLPVVLLLRCKCVCKLWFSLISDPYFINRHAKNNAYAHQRRQLLLTTEKLTSIKTCHVSEVLHDEAIYALEINYPFRHLVKCVWFVGSCNGLSCLSFGDDYDNAFCIWNPSTRRSSKRFSPRLDFDELSNSYSNGFGYDESTDDYKVVDICRPLNNGTQSDDTLTTYIYSLKSGSWKKFGPFPQGFQVGGSAAFSNGALHWLADDFLSNEHHWRRTVVSFDLTTETFGEISLPSYGEGPSFSKLGDLGEWLCVLYNYPGEYRGDLWVMKVYGVTSSWKKLFSIPYPTHLMTSPYWIVLFVPLCILNDGKILLQLGSTLVVYNSKNSSISELPSYDICREAITFVESLVSPNSQ